MYPYNNQSHNDQQFFNIPDEFIIKEKFLTIGTDVKLLKDNQQFSYIKQKMFIVWVILFRKFYRSYHCCGQNKEINDWPRFRNI